MDCAAGAPARARHTQFAGGHAENLASCTASSTLEDSNRHITFLEKPFAIRAEFPLFPEILAKRFLRPSAAMAGSGQFDAHTFLPDIRELARV